ncbi:DUF3943 domain-containing protein [bacterium]|nr:DUF3943 domain-containing protein [bacterium]
MLRRSLALAGLVVLGLAIPGWTTPPAASADATDGTTTGVTAADLLARPAGADDPDLVVDRAHAEPRPNFARTAAKVVGVNMLVWTYDRFIREGGENPVFRVGFNSWEENLRAGWSWDDNSFNTNQFAHPYHGSLYFNAARSNGYDFWSSVPFAFGGSWLWENMFETHHPSMNDWIATSVGGAALGEILHRLARTVRDETATGSERTWREIGGMAIDPIGGLTRLIDGEWGERGLNPPDRFPNSIASTLDVGLRTRGEDRLWVADTTRVYLEFAFDYGSPFTGDLTHPYDHFAFLMQVNFGDASTIGRVEGNGYLAGVMLKDTASISHLLGAYHRYDFHNTRALEFGSQSFTAGLVSRFHAHDGFELRTEVHAGPILLGGTSSDHESVSGRSYDYGPGFSARVAARFLRDGWDYLRMSMEQHWIHAISGNEADHHVTSIHLRGALPVRKGLGLGMEYVLLTSERTYRQYEDVSTRNPQTRVFATWSY